MEYRGVEFCVLQSIPRGWRWEFQIDDVIRYGVSHDKNDAAMRARRAIDREIELRRAAGRPGVVRYLDGDIAAIEIAKRYANRTGKAVEVRDADMTILESIPAKTKN